jgi:23S rRNA (cytidine1920-2'-O)/16S rRNA (cytidine1409-2'-O)-methyltransferase
MARSRLDQALVARGFFPTRSRAQAAVMAGRVRVDGRAVDKPGTGVQDDADLDVRQDDGYVSRGGV